MAQIIRKSPRTDPQPERCEGHCERMHHQGEGMMKMKSTLIATIAIFGLSAVAYAQNAPMEPGATNAPPGTSYPGTGSGALPPPTTGTARPGALDSPNGTAGMAGARAQIEAAGFNDVKGLSHHTDGTWRGRAVKNGVEVAVVLEPSGQVMVQ